MTSGVLVIIAFSSFAISAQVCLNSFRQSLAPADVASFSQPVESHCTWRPSVNDIFEMLMEPWLELNPCAIKRFRAYLHSLRDSDRTETPQREETSLRQGSDARLKEQVYQKDGCGRRNALQCHGLHKLLPKQLEASVKRRSIAMNSPGIS